MSGCSAPASSPSGCRSPLSGLSSLVTFSAPAISEPLSAPEPRAPGQAPRTTKRRRYRAARPRAHRGRRPTSENSTESEISVARTASSERSSSSTIALYAVGETGGGHRPPSAAGARSRLRDAARPHLGQRRPHRGGPRPGAARRKPAMTNCSRVIKTRSPIMPPNSGSRSAAIPSERSRSRGRIFHSARSSCPRPRAPLERPPAGLLMIGPTDAGRRARRCATCTLSARSATARSAVPDTDAAGAPPSRLRPPPRRRA